METWPIENIKEPRSDINIKFFLTLKPNTRPIKVGNLTHKVYDGVYRYWLAKSRGQTHINVEVMKECEDCANLLPCKCLRCQRCNKAINEHDIIDDHCKHCHNVIDVLGIEEYVCTDPDIKSKGSEADVEEETLIYTPDTIYFFYRDQDDEIDIAIIPRNP